MDNKYYLDHNATTPMRPEVLEAMMPYMNEMFGNASSIHWYGQSAKNALETSRDKIAGIIGADSNEVFFTGCGTESDNIALAGYLSASDRKGMVTTAVEHSAILKTAERLNHRGTDVSYINVDNRGIINLDRLRDEVDGETALVSVMHANNETGVLQPIREAAEIAHAKGAVFHTDAVQSAGKIHIDVKEMDIDMLSMSAHKINALKGVGALYIRKGVEVEPLTFGGSHERGIRPGTENIAGIVGFAAALEIQVREREEKTARLSALRDRLEKEIEKRIPNVLFNGRTAERLPGTTNISFPNVDGEALLFSLDIEGIAVSTGSACTSGEIEPSHVLVAMGIPPNVAQSSLRFSLGYGNTDEDIDHVIAVLPRIVDRLKTISGKNGN